MPFRATRRPADILYLGNSQERFRPTQAFSKVLRRFPEGRAPAAQGARLVLEGHTKAQALSMTFFFLDLAIVPDPATGPDGTDSPTCRAPRHASEQGFRGNPPTSDLMAQRLFGGADLPILAGTDRLCRANLHLRRATMSRTRQFAGTRSFGTVSQGRNRCDDSPPRPRGWRGTTTSPLRLPPETLPSCPGPWR
jgi:hypothetical protein